MRSVPSWEDYFLNMAATTATRSKDPSTQVGAVLVNPDGRIISQGFNGMPAGMLEAPCWPDDLKDDLVVHAEVNAVANAARSGVSTLKATLYITLPPCLACARVVAASGISAVVFPKAAYEQRLARNPVWKERFARALKYLDDANVEWRMVG